MWILKAAAYKKMAIALMLVIWPLMLSGCTTYDVVGDIKAQRIAVPPPNSAAPRFEDSKPHEWAGRTPWHYPIHGIDVSRYQGIIDWAQVKQAGIAFAFIKATEGGDVFDTSFEQNWRDARAAGIPRAAYHFYYFCRSPEEQAKWFIRHVPRDNGALPHVLDMEWNHASRTCKRRPSAEQVRKEMAIYVSMITKHYGKKPIIYTTVDFFDDNDLSRFQGYPFWLRSVAGHPDEKYGPHPWTFWQYTGTGRVPGIEGNVDINVFASTPQEWQRWLYEH